MNEWVQWFREPEPVAIIVLVILLGSLVQGMRRGASGSARRLFFFVWEAAVVVLCLVLAGLISKVLSPMTARWLIEHVKLPLHELSGLEQGWYTWLTSMRDFALLRYGVLFLLSYLVLRALAAFVEPVLERTVDRMLKSRTERQVSRMRGERTVSRLVGALIGAAHGAGRSLVFVALLFVYVSLMPSGWYAAKISDSPLYAQAASWLPSGAEKILAGQGPVLTAAVETQFQQLIKRKFEIADYAVPAEIEQAAIYVTKDAHNDEEKARKLYDWLGSRIAYDWDKANNYEKQGIWKEQTPAETFDTRRGVCIDIARLYAVMARTAGLEVEVATGMGADGRGGFGPHAWNIVKINNEWIPLDATWASSGDWFNPPKFDRTHIREA